MSEFIKALTDASYYLRKWTGLIAEETGNISCNIAKLKYENSPFNRNIVYKEIEDSIATIDQLNEGIEEIQVQIENLRRDLVQAYN